MQRTGTRDKKTIKHLLAITAAALITLRHQPVNAEHKNGHGVGSGGDEIQAQIDDLQGQIDDLAALQEPVDDLLNLLNPKTIFVTSQVYTGDMVTEANTLLGTSFTTSQGLEAGDALCQSLADSLGSVAPTGEYVAFLGTDEVNASSRITPSSGPYIRNR